MQCVPRATARQTPVQVSCQSAPRSPHQETILRCSEKQFNAISAELIAEERLRRDQKRYQGSAAQPPEQSIIESRVGEHTYDEALTRQIESVLDRLQPIERAIMRTPACTIAGLGVKARHAAYVMSQYWEAPIDRIDWDAQAVRLLIEAVCNFARTPLPFRNVRGDK